MNAEARRPMIVTFKKKEQRKQPDLDKQEVLRQHVPQRMDFYDVVSMQDMSAIPPTFEQAPSGMDINLYELPVLTGSFTEQEIRKLQADDNVERVEDDPIAYAVALAPSAELPASAMPELIREETPSAYATETIPWGIDRIDAERAWEVTRGAGIKVAVIDTGIDHQHHDLSPNFGGGVSFVPGETFTDGNGHGTHVAGTIGARANGKGVVGAAPNCSLYSVKALDRQGQGQYSWIISAILWSVRNRMDIINLSLGGSSDIQALQMACDYAAQHDTVVVAAAGNTSPNSTDKSVRFPAHYDSVIGVSAIDENGTIAPFSCRGEEISLCAPGVRILSTLPGNHYGVKSGTSMAAPHVAGTAALAVSSHRFTPAQIVRRLLEMSADNLGIPGHDPDYGYGLVDAEQAAFMRTLH